MTEATKAVPAGNDDSTVDMPAGVEQNVRSEPSSGAHVAANDAAAAAGEAVSNAPREAYVAALRTRVRRCAREPLAGDLRDSEEEEEESEADAKVGRSS